MTILCGRHSWSPWGVALASALSTGSVHATVLLVPAPPVFDAGTGLYTYSYTIDNSHGSFSIDNWQLVFSFSTPDWNQYDAASAPLGEVGGVVTPAGWVASPAFSAPGGGSAQDFSVALGTAVGAGETLAGFVFQSALPPGPVTFWEFGGLDSLSGSVSGPAGVPDSGASWVLLGLATGFWGVCGGGRRR